MRADIERAQRQGLSYEQFRAAYRPSGGDISLRQLWDEQQVAPSLFLSLSLAHALFRCCCLCFARARARALLTNPPSLPPSLSLSLPVSLSRALSRSRQRQRQRGGTDARTHRLSDAQTLEMLRQLDAAASAKAGARRRV